MGVISKEELQGLIEGALSYKRNYFEHLTLSYKVTLLRYMGKDVGVLRDCLNEVKLESSTSVNEQFIAFATDKELASSLIETDDLKLLKYGYEVGLLQIQSELLKLTGLVNGEKLLKITNAIKSFMTEEFKGLKDINKDIQVKINQLNNQVEELFVQ